MKDYIGTKIIKAKTMTREEYNDFRGWELPSDERGEDTGYLVEFAPDGHPNVEGFAGYISWSPAGAFEEAYKQSGSLSFGDALVYLKAGERVARKGWNGKGMWLALTSGSTIPKEHARSGAVLALANEGAEAITINDHIDMRTADGSVCCGWLASQADMLSDDWVVLR